jgi:putative SOS response-associated peptidase YedK
MKTLLERFRLEKTKIALKPRYNIAPTQKVPVVFSDHDRELGTASWGIPAWPGAKHPLFNARAESIAIKPSFKKDFEARRCLMLADSFYEWKQPEKKPFRILLKDKLPFAFAGIFHESEEGRSCCMITTSSNSLISQVHDRMPVILHKEDEENWLHEGPDSVKQLLAPYEADLMEMYEISSLVNSAANDSPDVILPKSEGGALSKYF